MSVMTLDICNEKTIAAPTVQQIRDAVLNLEPSGEGFLILGPEDMTYIQVAGAKNAGFDLEYQEGSLDRHYRATRTDWSSEAVIEKLCQYADGDLGWKDGVDWEICRL